ncbi:hypothetical protein RND81_04G062200 [Saponaria officinalis]|uniref:Uncharacterized protein n=1 Tax=Saponaria officinalis TaxID=3572 RepID=A0AAW1LID2_SAPOF
MQKESRNSGASSSLSSTTSLTIKTTPLMAMTTTTRLIKESDGVSGTTWKKRSKHGLPVWRKVVELFSVKPICGGGEGEGGVLKLDTTRSINGSDEDGFWVWVWGWVWSWGGPKREGGDMMKEG